MEQHMVNTMHCVIVCNNFKKVYEHTLMYNKICANNLGVGEEKEEEKPKKGKEGIKKNVTHEGK